MAIKNFTTKINEQQTCGEITGLLASKGARRIQIDYDELRRPTGISFVFPVANVPVFFRLPANFEGVYKCLCKTKGVPYSLQNMSHARNVAWRIVKDWVGAQLALVEAGAAEIAEVFLPYAVNNVDGRTVFECFMEQQAAKCLPPGSPIEEVA